jgi:polyhydroxybutyrate depolymerase
LIGATLDSRRPADAGGCCPQETVDGVDDVAHIKATVWTLRARYAVLHRQHAFHVGMSNGGMMANRLACELGADELTAVSSVSGPLVNGSVHINGTETIMCEPKRPVPILHIHGDADTVVPFGGCNATHTSGPGKVCLELHEMGAPLAAFPAVPAFFDEWRERNGVLNAPSRTSFAHGTTTCTSWAAAGSVEDGTSARGANTTLCVVGGEGHAWPGMKWSPACLMSGFHCNNDMDASAQIWNFFKATAALDGKAR